MIERMPAELGEFSRVLLLCGGGSLKRNGLYEQIIAALAGKQVIEFWGIEPNPEYETCRRAISLGKQHNIDFVLAAGGGSVADAAKFIALAYYFEGPEPWDIITGVAHPPEKVLPVACIPTLPASGSEANNAFVISRREFKSKRSFSHINLFPRFSILDPEATYSLSAQKTALGIVDIFVHTLEQYLTYPTTAPLQDRQAEAILSTLIETAQPLLANLSDYDLRSAVMWCAGQAVNGTISRGVPVDWATHAIGHELTALYDLAHPQTLALVLGGLYSKQLEAKRVKLAQYGHRVWQLSGSENEVAAKAIAATDAFFEDLGVPTRFSAVGLEATKVAEELVAHFAKAGFKNLGERKDIDLDAVAAIICSRA